ncbi:MAG: hypothetical protein RXS23_09600 [Metallosphaera yellowstonensis]
MSLLIKDELSLDVGSPKRVGVIWDVSPVPLGSKESRDPPTLKWGRWLRAEPLHSIMVAFRPCLREASPPSNPHF